MLYFNAVAPDWNLKMKKLPRRQLRIINAVAPDWNLKRIFGERVIYGRVKCSRTRLEFKDVQYLSTIA